MLKWQYQSGRRGSSWQRTIKEQRRALDAALLALNFVQSQLDYSDVG
ncbi:MULTISPECIES: DUF29 family protein [Burkholderiaceae]|nr:DUF29 family protein [Burkholderia sp. b13]